MPNTFVGQGQMLIKCECGKFFSDEQIAREHIQSCEEMPHI